MSVEKNIISGLVVPRERLEPAFFQRDVLEVAPDLIGKILVRKDQRGVKSRLIITETEAYRGQEDKACHAAKGRTLRTEVMFREGGFVYIYLIYGMYWMLNFVTGKRDNPQATLIRGLEGLNGPGKLTKALKLDKSFYGEDLGCSDRMWVENSGLKPKLIKTQRIGVEYAGPLWAKKQWRWVLRDPVNAGFVRKK